MRKFNTAYSFQAATVDAWWRYEFGQLEWLEDGIPCNSDEWERFYRYDKEVKREQFPFSNAEIEMMREYADYDHRALDRYLAQSI